MSSSNSLVLDFLRSLFDAVDQKSREAFAQALRSNSHPLEAIEDCEIFLHGLNNTDSRPLMTER